MESNKYLHIDDEIKVIAMQNVARELLEHGRLYSLAKEHCLEQYKKIMFGPISAKSSLFALREIVKREVDRLLQER